MSRVLRFPFDEKKALEALVLVASEWPRITAFFASKVLFLADKAHLSRFGRPVVGDRYIAMESGPVPSILYDWFKGNLEQAADPDSILESVEFVNNGRYVTAKARRTADDSYLSPSDVSALKEAIDFCRNYKGSLSRYTHNDLAWSEAELNSEMNPVLMIEGERRDEMVEAAEEYAAYGVA